METAKSDIFLTFEPILLKTFILCWLYTERERVDGILQHPDLVTQGQFHRVSEKVLTSLTTVLLQAALKRFSKFKGPGSFKKYLKICGNVEQLKAY
jgi:hypothetical protein